MSDIGATYVDTFATAVTAHAPLLRTGDVVDAAIGAFQLYRLTADDGADIINIGQRAQVQPAASPDETRVEVVNAVAAVDGKAILRQQSTAAVGNITAR